jgi:hypothetical protein
MRRTTKRRAPAKRKTTRRRRRVSGIGKTDLGSIAMDVAALAGGAIIARELSTIVLKQLPGTSQLMIGAGQIAAGVILPLVWKTKLGQDLGNGMIAFGGQVVAVNVGLISGIGEVPVRNDVMSYRISGGANLRAISGGANLRAVSGGNDLNAVSGNMADRVTNPVHSLGSTY